MGRLEVALVVEDSGKVMEGVGGCGVVGAEVTATDSKGALKLSPGTSQITQSVGTLHTGLDRAATFLDRTAQTAQDPAVGGFYLSDFIHTLVETHRVPSPWVLRLTLGAKLAGR